MKRNLLRKKNYVHLEHVMSNFFLTQEILKELIHYNPETGIFTWKERDLKWFKSEKSCGIWNMKFSGKVAGNIHGNNKANNKVYWRISVLSKRYQSHNLAFLYMTGRYVDGEVDHEDGDSLNNKWNNLREVTHLENGKNIKLNVNNKTGCAGTYFHTRIGKWKAQISHNTKRLHLGYFDKLEDAIIARKQAEKQYGYHENHGK